MSIASFINDFNLYLPNKYNVVFQKASYLIPFQKGYKKHVCTLWCMCGDKQYKLFNEEVVAPISDDNGMLIAEAAFLVSLTKELVNYSMIEIITKTIGNEK